VQVVHVGEAVVAREAQDGEQRRQGRGGHRRERGERRQRPEHPVDIRPVGGRPVTHEGPERQQCPGAQQRHRHADEGRRGRALQDEGEHRNHGPRPLRRASMS
jgi:hypothetical protein